MINDYVAAHRGYAHVVASKDYHIDPGDHFSEHPDYRESWPRHCEVGTAGVEFHPAPRHRAVEAVFTQGPLLGRLQRFEGADDDGTRWPTGCEQRGVEAVDIVGIATDYCVQATAADAVQSGFATRVLLDLTAGVAPESTAKAVEDLRAAGVEIA